MTNEKTTVYRGPSFVTLLAILFIALKLIGVITWSWWWVLSPIWIGFTLFCTVIFVMVCLMAAAEKMNNKGK
jgi:fatty acid desaturase